MANSPRFGAESINLGGPQTGPNETIPRPATVSVSGTAVTVAVATGFSGSFWVTVVGSDGLLDTAVRFLVTVAA